MRQFTARGPMLIPTGYVGPGDITTFGAWWGLRAYTNASIGSNAILVRRASDSATLNIPTIAGGGLDMAALATFLTSTTGTVEILYDQTGGGFHFSSDNFPTINQTGLGSKPTMDWLVTTGKFRGTGPALNSGPYSFSAVFKVTADTGSPQMIALGPNSAGPLMATVDAAATTNFAESPYGGVISVIIPFGSFHAVQVVYNGASSDAYVDGTSHTGTLDTASQVSGATYLGQSFDGTQSFAGSICEFGYLNGDLGANKSVLNSNQRSYWGF